MFPIQNQISIVTRAGLESSLALSASLSQKALEGVEKLIHLNVAAAKASMEESKEFTRQMLQAKDPQEFLSVVGAQARPNFGKAVAYGNHVAGIASTTQAEFTKAAEQQIAEASRRVKDLVVDTADGTGAQAGPANMMAMMKSVFDNATAGYEQFTRSSRQAVDAMGANVNAGATTSPFSPFTAFAPFTSFMQQQEQSSKK